jgi:RND family efflux transporter MFP subunit
MSEVDLNKLRIERGDATQTARAHAPATAPRKRGWRVRWWMLALLLAGLGGGYFLAFPPALPVATTQVVLAYPSQQYVLQNSTGYVVARRRAAVASKGSGRVEWLGVIEGSRVRKGELIARLESRDVEATLQNAIANTGVAAANVESARVDLVNAETHQKRSQSLFDQRFISQTALDDAAARTLRAAAALSSAQAGWRAARANENFARNAVDYTRLTAPFDGVVISRSANVGDIVTPLSSAADAKGAVAILADLSTLEVNADVSESSLASIRTGQPCEIVFDAFPDKRYRGVVSTIVPTVNRSSATVTTKVRILEPDAGILPDMSARVAFLSRAVDAQAAPSLAVNPDAIVARDSRSVVFRIGADGRAHQIAVTPGAMLGEVRALNPAPRARVGEAGTGPLLPRAAYRLDDAPRARPTFAPPADTPLALKTAYELGTVDGDRLGVGDVLVLKPVDALRDNARIKLAQDK